jgi:hypothetical protein
MTTLEINDVVVEEIISTYWEQTIVDYIKKFKPRKRINKIDNKLKELKIVNINWWEKIESALDFLWNEFKNNWEKSLNESKKEYFSNKFNLWV